MKFKDHYVAPIKSVWHDSDAFFNNESNYFRTVIHKNYTIGMHSHDFFELNVVIGGSGTHYVENSSLSVGEGDVFVVLPDCYHGYRSDGDLDVFHFIIKKEFLKIYEKPLNSINGFSFMFDIEPFLRQKSGAHTAESRYFLHLNKEELSKALLSIKELVSVDERREFLYQDILAFKLLYELCTLSYKKQSKKSKELGGKDIIKLTEFIHQNISAKITVRDIADKANMSPSTVTRFFKSVTGLSPMEYVISARKRLAVSYLESTDLSKSEIAQICGFYDLSHMEKTIKE